MGSFHDSVTLFHRKCVTVTFVTGAVKIDPSGKDQYTDSVLEAKNTTDFENLFKTSCILQ